MTVARGRNGPTEMATAVELHLEVAKELLVREGATSGSAEDRAAAAGRVYCALFRVLAPVIGAAGVQALFSRSARLSKDVVPRLAELLTMARAPNGEVQIVQHLVGCLTELGPGGALDGATVLFARFLGLIAHFIGERLVFQILNNAPSEIGEKKPLESSS